MNREEFIAENPIQRELERRGVKLIGGGDKLKARCPFHDDKNPSFSVNIAEGVWFCHSGCGGGSVIDLIAKFEGKSVGDLLREESKQRFQPPARIEPKREAAKPGEKPTIETTYQYRDAFGNDVYQVVRMRPKTFRQRHYVDGQWVWNMEGIERVLYRLPEVMAGESVWVVEGEKDADNLVALGLCATTNVGGAGKWMEGYTDSLTGKKVVLCGDNDKPGREHVEKVFESLAGKAAEVRIVSIPSPHKDVSDFIAASGSSALEKLLDLHNTAQPFYKGVRLPIYSMAELEDGYSRHCRGLDKAGLSLAKWIPSFHRVRPLVPGELVMFLGGTGVGKTALLSNLAVAASPLATLFFQLELPPELLFERLLALKTKMACDLIESGYKEGDKHGPETLTRAFPSLFISTQPRLGVGEIEALINRAELKMGERPRLVLIDYVGLLQGKGSSRYDRFSQIAEDLKVMAKATQTIVVCACQISRKSADDGIEVTLTDAKDSGSIENSSGLVIGAWRDDKDSGLMHLRILKNTKGKAGETIPCNYNLRTLQITERSRIDHD